MNLIGYLRVSSETQLDGYGLDAQRQSIQNWARREGHRVVQNASDLGISGATDALDRPGLSEALAALDAGRVQGIVVARLDRLARALTVQEATLAIIWRTGGHLFAADVGEVLADDPDDPMRTALRQVVGVFAELDRRMVTKRLRDGRQVKQAAGGKAVGAYRFGYQGVGVGRRKRVQPQPREQEAVRLILALRNQGQSYRMIATQLDARGLRPRRAASWSPMSVRSVVLQHTSEDV